MFKNSLGVLVLFTAVFTTSCSVDSKQLSLGGPNGLEICPRDYNCASSYSGPRGTLYVEPLSFSGGSIIEIINSIIYVIDQEGGEVTMQIGNYIRAEFKRFGIFPVIVEAFVSSGEGLIHFRAISTTFSFGFPQQTLENIIYALETPDE